MVSGSKGDEMSGVVEASMPPYCGTMGTAAQPTETQLTRVEG